MTPLRLGLVWLTALLAGFVVLLATPGLAPDVCLSADGGHDVCYCEAFAPGLVKQLSNTATSTSYALVGLLLLGLPASGARVDNLVARDGRLTLGLGLLAVWLGVGSMAFHATMSDLGGFLDSTAMYLFITFFGSVQALRLGALGTRAAGVAWLGVNAVMLGLARVRPELATVLFGMLLVGVVVLTAVVVRRERIVAAVHGWLFGALGLFLVGFAVWLASRTGGPLCLPHSLAQGHGVWHLCTAGSVGGMAAYLRRVEDLQRPGQREAA